MAQTDEILEALKSGRKLTVLDALDEFGCYRLTSRVWDLKQQGFAIQSEMITTESGKRVAQYSLKQQSVDLGQTFNLFY